MLYALLGQVKTTRFTRGYDLRFFTSQMMMHEGINIAIISTNSGKGTVWGLKSSPTLPVGTSIERRGSIRKHNATITVAITAYMAAIRFMIYIYLSKIRLYNKLYHIFL